jgi:hypothetical protein
LPGFANQNWSDVKSRKLWVASKRAHLAAFLSAGFLAAADLMDAHFSKYETANLQKQGQIPAAVLTCSASEFEPGSALHHHIEKPTGSPVGFFSPTPACLRGFPRVLADFAPATTSSV